MLSWILSATTILVTELLVRKSKWAWPVGLGNQVLWITFAVTTQQYGLLPLSCFMAFQNVRGWLCWSKS